MAGTVWAGLERTVWTVWVVQWGRNTYRPRWENVDIHPVCIFGADVRYGRSQRVVHGHRIACILRPCESSPPCLIMPPTARPNIKNQLEA